jgi:Spy/CpxP family protein refolding chaperone
MKALLVIIVALALAVPAVAAGHAADEAAIQKVWQ